MKRFVKMLLLLVVFLIYSCSTVPDNSLSKENYILPVLIEKPEMYYPPTAEEGKYSGRVKVLLTISSNGKVESATVQKSSGFPELDSSAINHTKQFVFIPGKIDNRPVYSRIAFDIVFNYQNLSVYARNYNEDIENLYKSLVNADSIEKIALIKRVLNEHNKFIEKMKDPQNFNLYISAVLLPEIKNEWSDEWNSWPLTFLLYYDFLKRFNEGKENKEFKSQMFKLLESDVKFIKKNVITELSGMIKKRKLLEKIKTFVTQEYSAEKANDLGL
ncbi:MAG: energy transducer TonB [Ignavibacteria bacterium]|nr:energy transducer TonB [Ignavibacteria bacterium]